MMVPPRKSGGPLSSGLSALVVAALLAGIAGEAPADPDTAAVGFLVGRVTHEGRPEQFANIIVLGTKHGGQSGRDGSFRLDGVPVGAAVIQVIAMGCVRATKPVEAKSGSADSISVELDCPSRRCRDQAHPTADCLKPNPEERRRIGSRCVAHPSVFLASDTVRVGYGLQIVHAELEAARRDSFPNTRNWVVEDCLVEDWAFTEVAYCGECRLAYERWRQGAKGRR